MLDILNDFYKSISSIDLAFLIITTLSVIKCYRKGFFLSLLAASKWLLAYVVTLVLFSRIKPYFKNIIDSEYVLDISLGIIIFILVITTHAITSKQRATFQCSLLIMLLSYGRKVLLLLQCLDVTNYE